MLNQQQRLMLPERIGRLDELAHNLWWSWHPQARELFRALDYPLWRASGHNPVRQLRHMTPDRLKQAATDPVFLAQYDAAMSALDADMSKCNSWFATRHIDLLAQPIAFFSAEFAIHNSLPIYAGGLGVLAGDICKEASDLGLPVVAVGFMYPQGYFHQHISASGWQEEVYLQLDFDAAPISPVYLPGGSGPLAAIQLAGRSVHISVWQVRLGCVDLYLLDTNIEQNLPQDRQLSARLYTADREQRIQQEIVLGIGGVRVLRALNIEPSVWHANEGHTAFMMLERAREQVEKGADFAEAVRKVRETTVFTTHTPVPAGQDFFPAQLMDKYFHGYWDSLATDRETFLGLGQHRGSWEGEFGMSMLALRMAGRSNAVSRLHGATARKTWHVLWPEATEEEVPIGHITNGVHVPTWVAPEMAQLFERYLGIDWAKRHDHPHLWDQVPDIPDEELWEVHQFLKRKLMRATCERAQERWSSGEVSAQQVLGMCALLDPHVLTVAFVRRFAEYKRPALILRDVERLKRIVNDPWRPVQIIFAGKSHPADVPSKGLLQIVYTLATERDFKGRIGFVEDFDMHMARYLVQGVDVWLNNPRRLNEASGTSGMKAALNGVLNLGVRDGWWHEACNGSNGWAIGPGPELAGSAEEDAVDAEALYTLLEKEVVPLYYQRDRRGVPQAWVRMVKESIRSVVPFFSARRMMRDYAERMYVPAVQAAVPSVKRRGTG